MCSSDSWQGNSCLWSVIKLERDVHKWFDGTARRILLLLLYVVNVVNFEEEKMCLLHMWMCQVGREEWKITHVDVYELVHT